MSPARGCDMRKLKVFNHVSLDGYFTDGRGDLSWAKEGTDDEQNRFTTERAEGGGVLLFGRVTYELMAGFWPTPEAAEALPEVAERMNNLPKVVFSGTLSEARWNNTTLVRTDPLGCVRRMKAESGPDLAILGSGSIVAQLAGTGLIDEYEFMLNPLALGAGRTLFEGLQEQLHLRLLRSHVLKNGKVFLCYGPA